MENTVKNISSCDLSVTFNLTSNDKTTTDNNTTKHNNIMLWYQVEMAYVYGTIISSFIAILTNILVVATFALSWKFWRHSLGILLLTLACVDIIGNGMCFVYFLLHILYIKVPVNVFYYVNNGFKRLSFLLMIPISVNRYALICRPFEHNKITSQKSTFIQITTLTVFAFTMGIFELYFMQMTRFMYNICGLIINTIMSVAFPLIVTVVLTVLVIRKFNTMDVILENLRPASRQNERNLTKAAIAISVAFIFLTLPSLVLRVISFFPKFENDINCYLVLIWLVLVSDVNFSINIFIYIICLEKFRSTLFGFFTCKCCPKGGNESLAMSEV